MRTWIFTCLKAGGQVKHDLKGFPSPDGVAGAAVVRPFLFSVRWVVRTRLTRVTGR